MSSTAELIKTVKRSRNFPQIVKKLNSALKAERAKRQRFYEEMTENQKVEFINGEVVLHSPAKNGHLDATSNLFALLHAWTGARKLGRVKIEKCLCVFPRNDYEPDIAFFAASQNAAFNINTMKFPVPDFVVEVLSDSTEKFDRGIKFKDYEAHGVKEYWIVDCAASTVEQYVLNGKHFELVLKSSAGEIISKTVAGFRIPIRAVFDDAENLVVLKSLL